MSSQAKRYFSAHEKVDVFAYMNHKVSREMAGFKAAASSTPSSSARPQSVGTKKSVATKR